MPKTGDSGERKARRDKGSLRLDPRRRRTVELVGVAVLVAIVVLVVPAVVASQPAFMKRFTDTVPAYRTWAVSVHAEVPCRSCHSSPGLVGQGAGAYRMLGAFYRSVFLREREFGDVTSPPNDACSSCHVDLRAVSPTGDLRIPHRAHVSVLKMRCVTCHRYLVHDKSVEGDHRPRMADCLRCHDGKRAKNACATCHTRKAAPRSHAATDWVEVHASRQQGAGCPRCHG
ncbi:MAG: hypothetical protein FDZ75_00240, partial [Actinobacteria bacterium]